jgi:hypothetical protein
MQSNMVSFFMTTGIERWSPMSSSDMAGAHSNQPDGEIGLHLQLHLS